MIAAGDDGDKSSASNDNHGGDKSSTLGRSDTSVTTEEPRMGQEVVEVASPP